LPAAIGNSVVLVLFFAMINSRSMILQSNVADLLLITVSFRVLRFVQATWLKLGDNDSHIASDSLAALPRPGKPVAAKPPFCRGFGSIPPDPVDCYLAARKLQVTLTSITDMIHSK